ncbi:DeoR family transcriptional regulator [Anaerostipes sp. 494a]|uniref:DeoR/GlpR family DNA-binding transcription regulator n=1 Tax=Anaerostipes TaxID=207244 RepID=UPI000951BF3D|nr:MULTISPECIES: DeoR/GlpR family DNA-binding transcription regulator [Anaerostipes]MCI5623899.1 DeoR/GlpR family DNA-binding transcription regulator [Anaerostipes sp.]OLR59361.1 DeoR family transcriptional regulator [Anaerostipes sp. 494a]
MAAKDRLNMIRQQLKADKKVTVSNLSRTYQVTEETIRRDLEKLEAEGFLTRTFGGAVYNQTVQKENVHFYKRAAMNIEEKKKIASASFDFLKDKNTLATDSSTTVMEAVKLLKDKDLTILSASTEIFRELGDTNIRIISTGGMFNKKTLSLQGQVAKDTVQRYHVNIALISCKGLDLEKGVTDTNESEAEVKKCMIRQAEEVALLVDHTKFGRTAFAHLLDFEDIDYLVTDERPDDEWIQLCREKNIQLIY